MQTSRDIYQERKSSQAHYICFEQMRLGPNLHNGT